MQKLLSYSIGFHCDVIQAGLGSRSRLGKKPGAGAALKETGAGASKNIPAPRR